MQIQYSYYRVPEVPFLVMPEKGIPSIALLYEYVRGKGFLEFGENIKPYAKGGYVCCSLMGEHYALVGASTCSMSDTFSYQIGKELSLLRATNLGLGHEDLDIGIMYRLDSLGKLDDAGKIELLNSIANYCESKSGTIANTMYFHPETAKIIPEIIGFSVKTSNIILKNHVWIGFEE